MKSKLDIDRLYKSLASPLRDFSKPVIIYRFRIGPDRVVVAPLQFIHTAIVRAKSHCPMLKNLAMETLESITHAYRV